MKNVILKISVFIILFANNGCNKKKTCSSLPEGLYEAYFTDEGKNAIYTPLYLKKIDENTFVMNSSNDPSFGPYIKRNGCSIGGQIEGKSCIGEITKKKGVYSVIGSYSYLLYPSGQGNPNPQYYEVSGTLEIKSNK